MSGNPAVELLQNMSLLPPRPSWLRDSLELSLAPNSRRGGYLRSGGGNDTDGDSLPPIIHHIKVHRRLHDHYRWAKVEPKTPCIPHYGFLRSR